MNLSRILHKKSTQILILATLTMLLLATAVFAQTTNIWDPDPVPDPTWDATTKSWVTTGSITFAQPYQDVCIAYGDDQDNLETAIECTLDTSTTPHPFTCSIPGTSPGVPNRTTPFYWWVYATDSSAGPCFSSKGHFDKGGDGFVAPNGTGPNAITLQTFNADNPAPPAILLMAALLTGFTAVVGVFILRKRSLS